MEHNPWNPVTRAIVKGCPVDADADILTARTTSRLLQAAGLQALSTDYFLYLPEKMFHHLSLLEWMLRRAPFGGQYAVLARALA
jgi:hypothetical protein